MEKMHTYRQAIVFLVIIVQYCSAIGYASDEAGCSHNGTMFADGSLVPSMEPCLSCKCVDSHLKCSLRVCPEQPIPPPRGCVLVHKRSSCCPHVSCNRYHNESENPNRRVITYNSNWYDHDAASRSGYDEDERQKVLSKNSLYRRIEDEETEGNDEMCVHNGTIYRTGSAMSTSSLCSYCYCIGGKQKCVRPKCLITSPGCVPVFIDSSCCPIRYDCKEVTAGVITPLKPKTIYYRIENKHYNRMRSRAQRNRGCLVASTYYGEGEKLPTDPKNPCDLCFCIRGENKCTPKKCAPYIGNCKPRIPEGQCCPAHYECDHADETSLGSSHRPRQFDLLSYFFSEETPENDTSTEPSNQPQFPQQQDYSYSVSSTSEKSFFDALRDGLNYIDSNDDHVEKILEPTGVNNASTTTDHPLQVNKTEPSFLDILLSNVDDGDDDDDDEDYDDNDKLKKVERPWLYHDGPVNLSDIATVYVSNLSDAELNNRYALLDEPSTRETTPQIVTNSVKYAESSPSVKTSNYDRSATERIISEYITYTSVPSNNFDTSTMSTSQDFETTTLMESTTQEQSTITPPRQETIDMFDDGKVTDWSTSTSVPTLYDNTFSDFASTKDERSTRLPDASAHFDKNEIGQTTTTTTEAGIVSAFLKEFSNLFGDENTLKEKHDNRPVADNQKETADMAKIKRPTQVSSTPSPSKTTKRVNPTIISSPAYNYSTSPVPVVVTSATTTTTPTPSQTTTISSSTPNSSPTTVTIHPKSTAKTQQTTTPIPITTTPSTTASKPSHISNTSPKINVEVIHSTSEIQYPSTSEDILAANQPALIDANPSILDSDLNYDYGDQPTLPPSLPNLKIIPFLPTDAVRKDNVHPKLEYYSPISTSYPVLTENYESPYLVSANSENQNTDFTAFEVSEPEAKDSPDFNSYSIRTAGYSNDDIFGPKTNGDSLDYSQYPSITEKPSVEPTIQNRYAGYNVDYDYDPFDKDHKYVPGSYEILDGHEYSIQSRNPSFDKFVTEFPERHVHSKIEFSSSNPLYGYNGNNKFSPPSKTEGGFLPKEPSGEDDQYYEHLQTTKHLPDLLTEPSPKANLTVQLIGITSEDPFKNVIRTEPPPNLNTLIEDKEKLFHTVPALSATDIDHDYPSIHLSDIEKEIISITTDSNYNSSPEYGSESLTDSIEYSLYHFDNDTINNASSISGNSETSSTISESTVVNPSNDFQSTPTTQLVPKDFLGDLLGYIFKDNTGNSESTESTIIPDRQTIPPFKKISSTSLSLMDILNFTKPVENSSKKVVIPQRKNNKIYEYPTTSEPHEETSTPPREENLNILRDVLLATLNSPSSVDSVAHRDSHPTIDVPKPIYSSHSIHQFLNPIFAGNSDLTHVQNKYSPLSSDIDLTIPKLNSQIGDNKDELNNNVFGPESYQVLNDYPATANHKPFGENPVDYDAIKEHHSDDNTASIYTKPLNGFQNSMGMLKLAGCNIYGRMYRVGRIITELSNPCLECKCTEVGVHCTTLSC